MLVETAWAAAEAPGPLHAFFVRIRARRGHHVAAVAVARKLAVLWRHMLSQQEDHLWVRPALLANKLRHGAAGRKATAVGQPPRVPPTPTTSRLCANKRCRSPDRPSGVTSVSSPPGVRARKRRRCADASSRQGLNEAARRRFQPWCRSSPRGRPRSRYPATPSKKALVHLIRRAPGGGPIPQAWASSNWLPQEVMALEAPDRVECLKGQD